MQLINTLAALATLASVGVAQVDPKFVLSMNYTATSVTSPDLDANDFFSSAVSFANSSLFVGKGVSTQIYSEPFDASFGGGGVGFTSYHSSPTGFTSLYLYPNDNKALGLTTPHSGAMPEGASNTGFGWGPDGYLTYNGENNFIGCENLVPNSYQIYWLGNKTDVVNPPTKCIGRLFLYRNNITLGSDSD